MFVLSAKQMQSADSHAIDKMGIPSIVLMENACKKSASIVFKAYPKNIYKNVIVFAGKGNNGGDGIGIARLLAELGYEVELVLLCAINELKNDPLINFNIYKNLAYKYLIVSKPEELPSLFKDYNSDKTIIIDAIFGTGLNKPLKESFYTEIIKYINDTSFNIVSIDVPSGLSDQFELDNQEIIKANMTIALQTLKTSHIYPDGNLYCGKIFIAEIGLPQKSILHTKPRINIVDPKDIDFIINERKLDSHKGNFGHCLNISGSKDKPGASILSSKAILRSGAGLCTTAVSNQNRDVIINAIPELMTKIYSEPNDLIDRIKKSDIILAGPGMGMDTNSKNTVKLVLGKATCPVVLDADAINLISGTDLLEQNNKSIILTPHLGEFSKLTGKSKEEIKNNRIALASDFAIRKSIYLVLKGHHTIIASPDGSIYINQTGNPGMATAGSGDVLSGIITGFLAQFIDIVPINKILAASVFIHGWAGDMAKEKYSELSMIASDIIEFLPEAIVKINDFKSKFSIS